MPAILERFGIDKLSTDEKVELIDAIEESMIDNDEIPSGHWEIINERLAEPFDPSKCYTLEQFKKKLLEKSP